MNLINIKQKKKQKCPDVYKLKKDVKGVEIGNYINIVLPKGTIIHNLPGGVFALHDSFWWVSTRYSSK